LIVRRNISIALHQKRCYIVFYWTGGVAFRRQDDAAGPLSSGADRLWAQIRALPD
jgi:hypothetical protein